MRHINRVRSRAAPEEIADLKAHDQTLTKIAAVAPKREPERRDATPIEVSLSFDDNRLASVVFGHYDQNIARIERAARRQPPTPTAIKF